MVVETARTIVLTGVSRGLGRAAAERLIRARPHDHYVVLARNDADRLAAALAAAAGDARVVGYTADLASLAETRRAASWIGGEIDAGHLARLGGYLGNAGLVLPTADTATVDGYETTFAVNVLAHYLLVRLLSDRFVAPAWIVLTASDVHFGQFRYTLGTVPAPRWEAPQRLATPRRGGPQAGSRAYATSKLGVVHLTHALARRLPTGVDVFSYNPALVVGTAFLRGNPQPLRALLTGWFRLQFVLGRGMTAEQAGARLAETLLGPAPGPTGSYLDRGHAVPSSTESYDEHREEELWREAGRLVGLPPDTTSEPATVSTGACRPGSRR
jgi:NAD(P)-dependent dehydrogenase (short-subunit alcohol dehydrogenase family)